MRVRRATAADVDEVAALDRLLFGADAWSPASVAAELTGPGRAAVVARDDDGAAAGYAVVLASPDVLDLERIAVSPAYRRGGLGRALLTAALEAAPARDRVLLEVSVANAGARAFYAAAGFAEVARRPRYYRDGSDALVLEAPASLRTVRRTG